MAKAKKVLSTVLAALMVVFTVAGYVPAKAAVVPQIKIVEQPQAEYKVGERMYTKVQCANFSGKVEYRATLWDGSEKKTIEVWKTYPYYYKNWQPTGKTVFPITWIVEKPGVYNLTVYVRPVGSKVPYSTYAKSANFTVKSADVTVDSIAPVADVTVNEGEKVTLPEKVTLNMSDKTTKEAKVTWAAVDTTKVGEATVEGTVEGTDKKATVKVVVKAVDLKVESVSAIKATTLKVTFNKAVDTTKAVLTTKRGNTVVATAAAWNETKTEATLTSSVKLIAGDYTVTVSGVDTAKDGNTASTTVAPERIETIQLANNAYRDKVTNTTATVAYTLLNQYGEDVTENYAATNFTATSNKGVVTGSEPTAKGVITITGVAADVTSLSVTVIDETFAKIASGVVSVQAPKAIDAITLAQPVIPTGKTKIENTATDVVLPYTAVNQFGEEITLADVSGLTFVSSDSTVLPTANLAVKSIDGKNKLVITAFGAFEGSKDVTLTAIVNATGKQSKVTFTVYGSAVANTPALVAPTTNPGVGDTAFGVELKMYDIYGTEMKAEDVAKLTASDVTVISSNTTIFTTAATPSLVNKKAVIQINAAKVGTANLMVTVNKTGKTSIIPITVVEAKYPASMTLVPDYTYAVNGADITLRATFKDQYGNAITTSSNVVRLSADNDNFIVKGSTGLKAAAVDKTVTDLAKDGIVLSATDWAKLTNVKAELINAAAYDAAKVLDTKTIAIQSVKADAALTYAVEEIGTISDAAKGVTTSPYAAGLAAYAKDASGNKVALKGDEIVNAVSASDSIVVAPTFDKVAAKDVDADLTSKIFVTVNTNAGVKVIEVPVKVSAAAPVAQSVKAMAGDTEVSDIELAAKDYTLASLFTSSNNNDLYFVVKDQYNTTALTADSYVTVFVKSATGVTKLDNTTNTKFTVEAGKTYTVTAITANGLNVSVNILGK